jgi:hypothetical protein
LATFFLQINLGFCSEEKVVRLIDLSPKEEKEWTGSESVSANSGKVENIKIRERKIFAEKIFKDEEEVSKTEKETGTWDAETNEETPKTEKETVQWLINSYILDTYKAQWDKILKDMDISLQKKIPDIDKRMQAYTSIQKTLELRKNRILKVDISEINKILLSSYFDYMIDALEKKKEGLKE